MPRSPMQPYSPLTARDPLPVDRLRRVEVARVQELRAHLEHAAVAALGDPAEHLLSARIERQLRRAADEQLRAAIARLIASFAARSIPNGFSPSRCLPAWRIGGVDLLVQVVRDARSRPPRRPRRRAARGSRRRAAGPGSSRSYQASTSGLVSQTTASSGRTPRSARCTQRAAALANSRPIRPPPIRPKRTTRSAMARSSISLRVIAARVVVLDHVAAVDDARGARAASAPRCGAGSRLRAPCRRRARAPAAAPPTWSTRAKSARSSVGSHLITSAPSSTAWRTSGTIFSTSPSDAVAALARLEHERLDHQRHPDRVARGAQRGDVANALLQELGLVGQEQQIDDDARGVEAAARARPLRRRAR